jgi:Ser/Thr protein kinase RdoA (MazF antagonist)
MTWPSHLLAAWGINSFRSVSRPSSGTMNETWLVDLDDDRVVLRRHRRRHRHQVESEHAVMAKARAAGILCPAIIPTVGGTHIVEHDGRFYTLYSWAPGVQYPLRELEAAHARSMGSTLAAIHAALAPIAGGRPDDGAPYDASRFRADMARLASHLRSRPDHLDLVWLLDNLDSRWRWLATNPAPPAAPAGDAQVIHGDYQHTNVFFEADAVSSVIDWDKSRTSWPTLEVIRAMDHGLGLDHSLCVAFLAGYRTLRDVTTGELSAAAERFGHQQACGLWHFEQAFVANNSRVAALAQPRPFIPFLTRWEELNIN